MSDGEQLFELLTELRADQRSLAAEQVRISQSVAELRVAIIGNGTKGLNQRVSDLEENVGQGSSARWQAMGVIGAAALGALGTAISLLR